MQIHTETNSLLKIFFLQKENFYIIFTPMKYWSITNDDYLHQSIYQVLLKMVLLQFECSLVCSKPMLSYGCHFGGDGRWGLWEVIRALRGTMPFSWECANSHGSEWLLTLWGLGLLSQRQAIVKWGCPCLLSPLLCLFALPLFHHEMKYKVPASCCQCVPKLSSLQNHELKKALFFIN